MQNKIYSALLLLVLAFSCQAVDIPFNFSWISLNAKRFLSLPLKLPVAAFVYVRNRWGYVTPGDVEENLAAQKKFYTEQFDNLTQQNGQRFGNVEAEVGAQQTKILEIGKKNINLKTQLEDIGNNLAGDQKKMMSLIDQMSSTLLENHKKLEFQTKEEIEGFAHALQEQRAELERRCIEIKKQMEAQQGSVKGEIESNHQKLISRLNSFGQALDKDLTTMNDKIEQMKEAQKKMFAQLANLEIKEQDVYRQIEELKNQLTAEQEQTKLLQDQVKKLLHIDKEKNEQMRVLKEQVKQFSGVCEQLERSLLKSKSPQFQHMGVWLKQSQKPGIAIPGIDASMATLKSDLFKPQTLLITDNLN